MEKNGILGSFPREMRQKHVTVSNFSFPFEKSGRKITDIDFPYQQFDDEQCQKRPELAFKETFASDNRSKNTLELN